MRSLLLVGLTIVASPVLGSARAPATPPVPSSPGSVAATVNGESITMADLDLALNANVPAIPLTIAQRRQLQAALLNDLIDDRLLKQYLNKHAPKVDPAELESQMKTLQAKLIKENRTLPAYLKETGQTEAQLRADWTAVIQISTLVKQQVKDDQLRAYFAANQDYFEKAEVRISQVMIRMGKSAPPSERAAAREKLQAIRTDLLAGRGDFATAARKFSQCPSGLKGGDLGFIPRRGMPEDEPIANAAFALKVGDLSDVVETDYGIHLLKVTDRKPGTPTTVEKSIVEVLEAYTDDYRLQLLPKLRKEAQIRISLP